MKSNKRLKLISLAVAIMIASTFFFSACGCNFFLNIAVSEVQFKAESYAIKMGEEKDFSNEVKILPSLATNKSFTLSAAPNGIINISASKKIQAVGVGSATLTATSEDGDKTAECTIEVRYGDVNDVKLSTEGKLMQLISEFEPIEFVATINEHADPETTFKWAVDGVEQSQTGKEFSFDPANLIAGVYEVKVSVISPEGAVVTDTNKVTLYNDFVIPPVASWGDDEAINPDGSIIFENDLYRKLGFEVVYTNHEDNPQVVVQWFVNGELKHEGDTFDFLPTTAGEYVVTVEVMGKPCEFEGGISSFTVIAKGKIIPTALEYDFDNCYPDLILSWLGPDTHYAVEIKNNTTGTLVGGSDVASNNAFYADRFDGTSFNLKELIDPNFGYTLRVKSLGNGGIYSESEYSRSLVVAPIPAAAVNYLGQKYFMGNYYMSDEKEFMDLFAYTILFRNTLAADNNAKQDNLDVYIAYDDYQGDFEEYLFDLGKRAVSVASQAGLYRMSVSSTNKVAKYSLMYDTGNIPTIGSTYDAPNTRNDFHAIRPHINYGEPRPSTHKFAIDYRDIEVAVKTSEELYFAAENGAKPIVETGSKAAELYSYAKSLLLKIVTDDMTKAQKAHAIYDWIMWRVDYDWQAALDTSIENGVSTNAYYLEGVLTTYDSARGVYPLAVCDGMAKAYSLLCNIEGIECIRVAGDAKTSSGIGGHAWNKVKLDDNKWYIVDCTWGDLGLALDSKNIELALHEYLFVTDAEVATTHFAESGREWPKTSTESYNWYAKKISFGGSFVDMYLSTADRTAVNAEISKLVDYIVSIKPQDNGIYTVPGNIGDTATNSRYFSFDLRIASSAVSILAPWFRSSSDIDNPIRAALKKAGEKDYSIYVVNDGKNVVVNLSY